MAAIFLQSFVYDRLEQKLESSEDKIFVRLYDMHQRGNNYFVSYIGSTSSTDSEPFRSMERVDRSFYHLHSEGKNLQVYVYRDALGKRYTRLIGNRARLGEDIESLKRISGGLLVISFIMFVSTFFRMKTA